MIKAVFFDLGDTLIHSKVQALEMRGSTIASFFHSEGLPLTPQDATEILNSLRPNEPKGAGNCYGAWFRVERTRIAAMATHLGLSLPVAMLDAMTLRFRRFLSVRTQVFEDTLPTLQKLREMQLHISVISNNDGRSVIHIEHHGLTPWLDHVIDSAAFGCTKPNCDIYKYALSRAGVEPHEAVMVGDSATSDAQGGVDAGLHGFWLNRKGDKQHPDPRVKTIQSLIELPDLLAGL